MSIKELGRLNPARVNKLVFELQERNRELEAERDKLREENAKWRAGELVTSDTAALEEAAQAVVDEVMMPVEGDYHYRVEESAAMDKLKAALK